MVTNDDETVFFRSLSGVCRGKEREREREGVLFIRGFDFIARERAFVNVNRGCYSIEL